MNSSFLIICEFSILKSTFGTPINIINYIHSSDFLRFILLLRHKRHYNLTPRTNHSSLPVIFPLIFLIIEAQASYPSRRNPRMPKTRKYRNLCMKFISPSSQIPPSPRYSHISSKRIVLSHNVFGALPSLRT